MTKIVDDDKNLTILEEEIIYDKYFKAEKSEG